MFENDQHLVQVLKQVCGTSEAGPMPAPCMAQESPVTAQAVRRKRQMTMPSRMAAISNNTVPPTNPWPIDASSIPSSHPFDGAMGNATRHNRRFTVSSHAATSDLFDDLIRHDGFADLTNPMPTSTVHNDSDFLSNSSGSPMTPSTRSIGSGGMGGEGEAHGKAWGTSHVPLPLADMLSQPWSRPWDPMNSTMFHGGDHTSASFAMPSAPRINLKRESPEMMPSLAHSSADSPSSPVTKKACKPTNNRDTGTANADDSAMGASAPVRVDRDTRRLADRRKRRRESHNAVERRRRDLINDRIAELAMLLPQTVLVEAVANSCTGGTAPHIDLTPFVRSTSTEEEQGSGHGSTASVTDDVGDTKTMLETLAQSKPNKGIVLTKSVEYIKELHEACRMMRDDNVRLINEVHALRQAMMMGPLGQGGGNQVPGVSPPMHMASLSPPAMIAACSPADPTFRPFPTFFGQPDAMPFSPAFPRND